MILYFSLVGKKSELDDESGSEAEDAPRKRGRPKKKKEAKKECSDSESEGNFFILSCFKILVFLVCLTKMLVLIFCLTII